MMDPTGRQLSPERLQLIRQLVEESRRRQAALYPPPKPPPRRRGTRQYPSGKPNPPWQPACYRRRRRG
jgi:hypothetical protein